jgi:hypothetical protein
MRSAGIRRDKDMNDDADNKIGTISLWASILGIVVPILIAFLVGLFVKVNDEPYYMLCILLFAGAELIALITGIIGRKAVAGKAGLSIALVCVLLTVLAIPFIFVQNAAPTQPSDQHPVRSQQGL